jgi:hypothetical protein
MLQKFLLAKVRTRFHFLGHELFLGGHSHVLATYVYQIRSRLAVLGLCSAAPERSVQPLGSFGSGAPAALSGAEHSDNNLAGFLAASPVRGRSGGVVGVGRFFESRRGWVLCLQPV